MSDFMYLASDTPFQQVKNPHLKIMSVNEALALGIEVPDFLLEDGTDRDQPDMIMWTDRKIDINDEQGTVHYDRMDDDFSIFPLEKQEDTFTEKQYCAGISWDGCTKGRAGRIASYIKEHLENTKEIEIWHIWMGLSYPHPRIKKVKLGIDELDASLIEQIYETDPSRPVRAAGYVNVPDDWGIDEDEMETGTQYCYTIVAE